MSPDPPSTVALTPPQPALVDDPPPLGRTLVLVGIMGAGKSSVGRRLAKAIGASFADADDAIIEAAGMSIADIFESYGEQSFRNLERRVIARLLDGPPRILALGGGGFIDPETRARVKAGACSIWLRADLPTLLARVLRKRATRPLLMNGDPAAILGDLMARRYPIYAEADHVVDSSEQPAEMVVQRIIELLRAKAPDQKTTE
jgi:shikimate kinase